MPQPFSIELSYSPGDVVHVIASEDGETDAYDMSFAGVDATVRPNVPPLIYYRMTRSIDGCLAFGAASVFPSYADARRALLLGQRRDAKAALDAVDAELRQLEIVTARADIAQARAENLSA